MTHELEQHRAALVATCRRLAVGGLSPGGSGNVSVRVGDALLITPTGSALGRVRADELALVDLGTGAPRTDARPSKELPLHLAMLRGAPSGSAVVHLHAAHATAIACLPPDAHGRAALPPLTPYRVMRLGEVPLVPYAAPGSAALAEGVARAAGSAVLLLASHGPLVRGAGLDEAADLAEELENAAQVTLLLAGSAAVPLDPDQVDRLRSPA